MSLTKEALSYLMEEQSKPTFAEVNGQTYSDKRMHRIIHNPKADPIEMNTLSSLIDYIKAGIDVIKFPAVIHIQSPTRVELYTTLDDERIRERMVVVKARVPEFRFNNYTEHEAFLIAVQSKFLDTEDKKLILQFAGTVENGTVEQYGDDGVTQKATVKTGIASKSDAIVPNPVKLKAFRTFIEVDQPETEYVFRMRDDRHTCSGIECALFEADGGAWEIKAMESIKEYLQKELEENEGFTVIS